MTLIVGLALALAFSVVPPAQVGLTGTASTYGPGYEGLTAVPKREWLGKKVRICYQDKRCIVRTANDYGPNQRLHPGRVVDLSAKDFERLCKCSWRTGLLKGVTVSLAQ